MVHKKIPKSFTVSFEELEKYGWSPQMQLMYNPRFNRSAREAIRIMQKR